MIRADLAQPTGGIPSCEEGGCADQRGEKERCGGKNSRTPPRRRADRCFGDLRQVGLVAQRWEGIEQSFARSLVEPDGTIEVLQPMLPEVAKEDVEILLLVLEQRLSCL